MADKKIPIVLPKKQCKICKQEFYERDMESHLQIAHPVNNEILTAKPLVSEKQARALANKEAKERNKWATHKYKHRSILGELKIKEQTLPNDIRLQILKLDLTIGQIKSPDNFKECSKDSISISSLIKKWHENKTMKAPVKTPEMEQVDPAIILEQGESILRQVRGIVITNPESAQFLNSVMSPNGFLKRAKSYLPFLKDKVQHKAFANNLELIEKIALEKIGGAQTEEPPVIEPEPFVSNTQPDIEKQYADLLNKNIVPIIDYLKAEHKKYIASIHKYLKLNTTSVFTYTYDEATEEITGSVEEIASIKKPFKS